MKIAALIARLLLGLVFLVFGLNGFLHFMTGPLPSGPAGQFLSALVQSHYDLVVSAVQIAGGTLLLANRYVPLGLVLLGPVIVNFLLSSADGPEWSDHRNPGRDLVGSRRLSSPPILLRHIRAAGFLTPHRRVRNCTLAAIALQFGATLA